VIVSYQMVFLIFTWGNSMRTNTDITIYKRRLDTKSKIYTWKRLYIKAVMWQEEQGTSFKNGFTESKNVRIFIPIDYVEICDFIEGDIVLRGNINVDTTEDFPNCLIDRYVIKTIKKRDFGSHNLQHIEIVGE